MSIMINGADFSDCVKMDGVKWQMRFIEGPNSGRSMAGTRIRDIRAEKVSTDVSCIPLTDARNRELLQALDGGAPISVSCDEDPLAGPIVRVMDVESFSTESFMTLPTGERWWHNTQFPLTER